MLLSLSAVSTLAITVVASSSGGHGRTFNNPAVPGWHSDPSCVFVPDIENTTFCTASSFMSTPGLPIIASKDLMNWKLVGHALTRPELVPEFDTSLAQSDGIWAATIRYHDGVFYIVTIFTHTTEASGRSRFGLILNSTDPFRDDSWSAPMRYEPQYIDPDLFWDVDGKSYITSAGTYIQAVDLEHGVLGEPLNIWNGTEGVFLEGPHIYHHDGFYYLLVAEGGSGLNHSVTIARSKNLTGPYESNPANPVMSNRNTSEYFQNIGHADLFRDAFGRWWSSALAWRSGPSGTTYPMGREMVLTPVTWPPGEWPEFTPVQGRPETKLLYEDLRVGGDGPFVGASDSIDFAPGSQLPRNFIHWRWPQKDAYVVSAEGHPNTLELTPSAYSITDGYADVAPGYDIGNRTLITRKQTDTLFQFSVDVDYSPKSPNEEVGITAYLNQVQNHALGIINLLSNSSSNSSSESASLHFRFITSGTGSLQDSKMPAEVVPVPQEWMRNPIRLYLQAQNETHYTFSASSTANIADKRVLAVAEASVLSGGQGDFTGM